MEQREFVVEQETAGQRIDRFLSGEDTGLSRSALQALVADGHVLCNGRLVAKSLKLKAGDTIVLEIPDAKPIEAVPQDIPLEIVYEDEHLLVVNKPKGMVVHPAPGNPDGTLVNALLWHCKGSLSGIGGEIRPGIVHRIDKDTSGLLVVARTMQRTSVCPSRWRCTVWSARIAPSCTAALHKMRALWKAIWAAARPTAKKMAVYPAGEPHTKYAYTGYQVLERLNNFTMLECRLKTGRTHQIRVHMASIQHPVAGDPVYGPHNCITSLHGQCLHAKNAWLCAPDHRRTSAVRFGIAGILHSFSCNAQEGNGMNHLSSTLVLCDLDHLLLGADGNLTQVVRDVLQLFVRRGGHFTVFSQRTPRAVRSILGSVRLSAPALVCGGAMAYHFSDGTRQPLCTFAGQEADLFARLPVAEGVGIALQMTDGTTRVLRMSEALERHLRQEWTPYLLANAADIKGEEVLRVLLYQDSKAVPMISLLEKSLGDRTAVLLGERAAVDTLILTPRTVSGREMLDAVCMPVGTDPEDVLVLAGGLPMLDMVRASSQSTAAADAPAELRLAAQKVTLTDAAAGSAVEVLYRMVRDAENLA